MGRPIAGATVSRTLHAWLRAAAAGRHSPAACQAVRVLPPPLVQPHRLPQALLRPRVQLASPVRALHDGEVTRGPLTPATGPDIIDVLYDGECPLCVHKITWLQKRSARRQSQARITFTDISAPGYDPAAHGGVTYEEGMKVMHVITNGRVVSGVESFQVMYEAVGLGFVVKALHSPTVKRIADRVYDVWARLRLPMSGRPSLEVLLARRAAEHSVCHRAGDGGADRCRS